MTFQTIRGATQVDFIGSDAIDILVAVDETLPIYVGGQDNNDFITLIRAGNGIISPSNVQGGQGSDTFNTLGEVQSSIFNGNKGNDFININSSVSLSIISGGEGDDYFTSPTALISSTLNGNDGRDTILFSGSADGASILGGPDDDSLIFSGSKSLRNSRLNGNAGNDFLSMSGFGSGSVGTLLTEVTVFGGPGDDILTASGGANGSGLVGFILSGDNDNDQITGSAQADTLLGGTGLDTIIGSEGADQIFGGLGADTFKGSAKETTYVITTIEDSAATLSGTVAGFDRFEAGAFEKKTSKLDISAVASTLAGGTLSPLVTAVTTSLPLLGGAPISANDFTALKTALDPLGVASSTSVIQTFEVTVAAGALQGTYLWINNTNPLYDSGDLFFRTNAIGQIDPTTDLLLFSS
ncbi:MAG: calcium-binding protein [Synechococcus sp.]|nr:calcium-binding protein [Synechococcus sp.]